MNGTITACEEAKADTTDFLDKESYEEDRKLIKNEIVWFNVILFTFLHIGALYGVYLLMFTAKWQTVAFGMFSSHLFSIFASVFLRKE